MNVFANSSGELQNSKVFSFQSIIGCTSQSQNNILITEGCDIKPFHYGSPIDVKVDQTLLFNASAFVISPINVPDIDQLG